ncbi:hypothetical protein CFP56_033967 [Quercus suber]|uniref:Uncharacterized protein n=1 Tax=Quercus suber TaxID=58331 RepID=A0AAW0JEI1_QUESU
MRKSPISYLSHISRHKPQSFAPFLFRNYISDPSSPPSSFSSSSSSSPLVSHTHLKPCAKTHVSFFKPNKFRKNPFRNMDTLVAGICPIAREKPLRGFNLSNANPKRSVPKQI